MQNTWTHYLKKAPIAGRLSGGKGDGEKNGKYTFTLTLYIMQTLCRKEHDNAILQYYTLNILLNRFLQK